MIGTLPTDHNDWMASLRINTIPEEDGYRIDGIYTGLLAVGQ